MPEETDDPTVLAEYFDGINNDPALNLLRHLCDCWDKSLEDQEQVRRVLLKHTATYSDSEHCDHGEQVFNRLSEMNCVPLGVATCSQSPSNPGEQVVDCSLHWLVPPP